MSCLIADMRLPCLQAKLQSQLSQALDYIKLPITTQIDTQTIADKAVMLLDSLLEVSYLPAGLAASMQMTFKH